MEYFSEEWEINKLISLYDKERINLNPPYQRNDIWSNPAKKRLIDSIKQEYPLPIFFLHNKGNDYYDVVDGQQRIRAIVGYVKELYKDLDKQKYSDIKEKFDHYKITVTVIDKDVDESTLSEFYYRVNKFGTKLNRPEILKAQYKDTKFLDLVNNIAESQTLLDLGLFSDQNMNRMLNLDFVSELFGLLEFGIVEKKKAADELFDKDIDDIQAENLYSSFIEILDVIILFNNIYPISKTRYKQRNDFYTMFNFIKDNIELKTSSLEYFYKILVLIGEDIYPSNDDSEALSEYAYYCVTQSNSKKAREKRLQFLNNLFLNPNNNPNKIQSDLLNYYRLDKSHLMQIERFFTLNGVELQNVVGLPKIIDQ